MSVLVIRGGGEPDPLVTVGELYREESHQRVEVVVPLKKETEVAAEGDFFLLHSLNINFLDQAVVGHHTLVVDAVHQRFGDGDLPDAGHVESVHVIPPGDLVVLVLPVLDTGNVQGGLIREHESSFHQPLVPGIEDGIQHGLVEQTITHPLGDDDVNLGHRQLDLLHLSTDDCNDITQVVVLHNLLGVVNDGAHVDTNHLGSSSLGSEHGENASTTANIQDCLPLEQMLVVPHRVPVRRRRGD